MGDREIYQVVEEHSSSFPYSFELKAGEEVTLSDKKKNGWIWGTDEKGTGAWVPEKYLELNGTAGVLLFDYDSTELNVTIGEKLVFDREESGWILCTNEKRQTGWVPVNKLEKL